MIEVSIEVREGPTPFKVAVRAESISQAVGMIEGRHPGRNVRVVFPIDPEGFFVGDAKEAEQVESLRHLHDPVMRA